MSLPRGVPNGDLPTAFGRKRPRDDGTYITYIHCIHVCMCVHIVHCRMYVKLAKKRRYLALLI